MKKFLSVLMLCAVVLAVPTEVIGANKGPVTYKLNDHRLKVGVFFCG